MIVTVSEDQLFEILIYSIANYGRTGKIHRSSFYHCNFPGRDHTLIHWCIIVSIQHQLVVEDIPLPLTKEVKVSVLGDVQYSRSIGYSLIIYFKSIVFDKYIFDGQFQCTRVSHIPVGTDKTQFNRLICYFTGFPDLLAKTTASPVQLILVSSLVYRKFIDSAIQFKLSSVNPVAITSDNGSKRRITREGIAFYIIKTK